MKPNYSLLTPEDIAQKMAEKVQALRLARNWKQITLAERSGVTVASLRRFERTGQTSLKNLLKLTFSLGRLSDFESLLQQPSARSIAELETKARKPKRGSL